MANQNPKAMSDDELEAVLAEGGIADPKKAEAPVVPEPPVEEEEPEEEPEEEVVPEAEEEEPAPAPGPSPREQLRINDLLAKYGPPKPAPQTAPAPTAPGMDYDKELEGDPELIKKLQADRQAAESAAYNRGMEQANSIRFHTRLEVDAPRIEAKYPALDKDNEKFNPRLAKAINTMYLSTVGYDAEKDTVVNPSIRYSEFVDSIYELSAEAAGEQAEIAKKNVVKQAAKTGLRPSGGTTKKLNLNKPAKQMSDEELDAIIAQAVPSN